MMVLIKLYATWCQPCKRLSSYLKDKKVKTTDVDIESSEGIGIARTHNILSVPALIYGDDVCLTSDPEDVDGFLERNGLK